MALQSRVSADGHVQYTSLAALYLEENHPRYLYDLLLAYYYNNDLYEILRHQLALVGLDEATLKPLRNPAFRVVEFYAAKVWPGPLPEALPIVTETAGLVEAVHKVWAWSNWAAQKQVGIRMLGIFGDIVLKAAQRQDGRPYLQLIEPRHFTDFDADARGYLTYVRLDIPVEKRDPATGMLKEYTHTEVWDKESGLYRRWEHQRSAEASLVQLGAPDLEQEIAEFGIDFLPFVHVQFRDVGEHRGVGAYTLQVDKIDEANRMATRLHEILFRHNKPLWALETNMLDAQGRPMPPPPLPENEDEEVELGGDRVLGLPGNAKLNPLIPDLRYQEALEILKAHMEELSQDLPELEYYSLREAGDLSGRAVRLLLSDAIDRVVEVRGNAEAGLVRAQQMALTLGANANLWKIGTYEAGDFEHAFARREVLPLSDFEVAETTVQYVNATVPLRTALRWAGRTEEDIAQMDQDREQEAAAENVRLAKALLDAQRGFDQEAGRLTNREALEAQRGEEE